MRKAVPQKEAGVPDTITDLLADRPSWPAPVTIAGLLREIRPLDSSPLCLDDMAICAMLSPQKLRTYSISNAPLRLPEGEHEVRVELTVTRQDFNADHANVVPTVGVASGYLNPANGMATGG